MAIPNNQAEIRISISVLNTLPALIKRGFFSALSDSPALERTVEKESWRWMSGLGRMRMKMRYNMI